VKITALCHREARSAVAISFSQSAYLVWDCFAALAIVTSRTGHDKRKLKPVIARSEATWRSVNSHR